MTDPIKPQHKLNHRLRRREARRALHTAKWVEARLLGVSAVRLAPFSEKSIQNIRTLQILINAARKT